VTLFALLSLPVVVVVSIAGEISLISLRDGRHVLAWTHA
jgi:hypothetical protein